MQADSFEEIFQSGAVLVPGGTLTVNRPPPAVTWTLDLAKSVAWQAHDLVVQKLKSRGEQVLTDALRQRTQAGAVLKVCTMTGYNAARNTENLEDQDLTEVLVNSLSTAAGTGSCIAEARTVVVIDANGQPVSLGDDLSRMRTHVQLMETLSTRLDEASRMSKAFRFVRMALT